MTKLFKLTVPTLTIIFLFGTLLASFPLTQAQVPVQEKSLNIIDNIVGFDLANSSLKSSQQNSLYMTLPTKETDTIFSGKDCSMRISCSFVGDKLQRIFVSNVSGTPSLGYLADNYVTDAKGFMERYQNYTNEPVYDTLKSMLESISANQNITKTTTNAQLEITYTGQSQADFVWTYIDSEGIEAPVKNIALSYRDGVLKAFLDNWQLYTIAGSPVVSSQEAEAMALGAVESYSLEVANTEMGNITVSDFKVASVGNLSLCYLNYHKESTARGGDPFTLYPSWFIPIGFDRVYPGGVTGVYVRIWADSGEVSSVSPMIGGIQETSGASVEKASFQVCEPALLLVICVSFSAIIIGLIFAGNRHRFIVANVRHKSLKLFTLFFSVCLICSFSVFASQVQAIPDVDVKSVIYGSLSGQFVNETVDEITAMQQLANAVTNYFYFAGYDATNAFGAQTNGDTILSNTYNFARGYDYVAVFYHGHMHGEHSYWCPVCNVTWSDIASRTTWTNFFVWSWSCMSAQQWGSWPDNYGLPYAWTKDLEMSNDGYSYPSGNHCYIGFEYASPALSSQSFEDNPGLAMDFIINFYNYALVGGYSINDALDQAAQTTFGSLNYLESPLPEYETWWPDKEQPNEEQYG
ncbi:MAG: hypothetical protein NWF01_04510 [Candidatus Bathyarchaeota archaeon]|nr:hypothetical protein [Candidatus Bathyarchaeota archaeon]